MKMKQKRESKYSSETYNFNSILMKKMLHPFSCVSMSARPSCLPCSHCIAAILHHLHRHFVRNHGHHRFVHKNVGAEKHKQEDMPNEPQRKMHERKDQKTVCRCQLMPLNILASAPSPVDHVIFIIIIVLKAEKLVERRRVVRKMKQKHE